MISPSSGFLESKATRDKLRHPGLDKRRVPTPEPPVPSLHRKIDDFFEKSDPPDASATPSPVFLEKSAPPEAPATPSPVFFDKSDPPEASATHCPVFWLENLTRRRPPRNREQMKVVFDNCDLIPNKFAHSLEGPAGAHPISDKR